MKYELLLMFTHKNDITKVTKAITVLHFLSLADNTYHILDFAFLWFWGREEERKEGVI